MGGPKREGTFMDFLQKNARSIVIALLVLGAVVLVTNNNEDTTDNDNTPETTQADITNSSETENQDSSDGTDSTMQDNSESSQQSAEVQVTDEDYSVSAVSGDNQTKLVRRIIDLHVEESDIEISAEQRLYVETNLVNNLPKNDLIYVGDTVKVTNDEMEKLVSEAKALTPAQISAWNAYL